MRRLSVILLVLFSTVALADRAALLSAIAAAPTDDTLRLVYADWLDEHGDPDRATFIRAQVFVATHGSFLGWGKLQADFDDRHEIALPVFLPGDSVSTLDRTITKPYTSVESKAVQAAEAMSRRLFQRHWRRWVDEIDLNFRARLRLAPNSLRSTRKLALLPGNQPSDQAKRWWYSRFRSGFFGAVRREDFGPVTDEIVEALFDERVSTIVEVQGALSHRANAPWDQSTLGLSPAQLRRLRSLSLPVLVNSRTGQVDVSTAALLGDVANSKAWAGIENVRIDTFEFNARVNAMATSRFVDIFHLLVKHAQPRRFFVRLVGCQLGGQAQSYGAVAADELFSKANAAFSRRLATLGFDHQTGQTSQAARASYLRRVPTLRVLHLGNTTYGELETDFEMLFEAIAALPNLRSLSWDTSRMNFEPAVTEGMFPSLKAARVTSAPIAAALDNTIRRNEESCPDSLAELSFLSPVSR